MLGLDFELGGHAEEGVRCAVAKVWRAIGGAGDRFLYHGRVGPPRDEADNGAASKPATNTPAADDPSLMLPPPS